MTSKEIVYRAIDFQNPPRIPIAKGPHSDMAYIRLDKPGKFDEHKQKVDEWGCTWYSQKPRSGDRGQVVVHPLENWEQLENYPFPDPLRSDRFEGLSDKLKEPEFQDKFTVGVLGDGPLQLIGYLRGFENFFTDLIQFPKKIDTLLEKIISFFFEITKRVARYKIDSLILYDDQAMQSGPMFSMELWRKHFKPRFKDLFDCIHDNGMKVYFHTCGNLEQFLIELCEIGVDIIDNKQPDLWMLSDSAQNIRGSMCYSSCIDIQNKIFSIKASEMKDEAKRLIETLSTENGGFVGTYYHQQDLPIPKEKNKLMIEAFQSYNAAVNK